MRVRINVSLPLSIIEICLAVQERRRIDKRSQLLATLIREEYSRCCEPLIPTGKPFPCQPAVTLAPAQAPVVAPPNASVQNVLPPNAPHPPAPVRCEPKALTEEDQLWRNSARQLATSNIEMGKVSGPLTDAERSWVCQNVKLEGLSTVEIQNLTSSIVMAARTLRKRTPPTVATAALKLRGHELATAPPDKVAPLTTVIQGPEVSNGQRPNPLSVNPVNTETARIELGKPGKAWSSSRMAAIKRAMGTSGAHLIFLSDVRKWLRQHPEFRERKIYPRKGKQTS